MRTKIMKVVNFRVIVKKKELTFIRGRSKSLISISQSPFPLILSFHHGERERCGLVLKLNWKLIIKGELTIMPLNVGSVLFSNV